MLKHVLECKTCNSDITEPLLLGTVEYDCTNKTEFDWENWKDISDVEARLVKDEYWTGLAWEDGEHIIESRYWLKVANKKEDIKWSRSAHGVKFQCSCGELIGYHLNVDGVREYLSADPKMTIWVEYIEHGKKRRMAKKARIKTRKKRQNGRTRNHN